MLTGTGGIADMVDEIVQRVDKLTGASVLYDDDPDRLVRRLIDYYRKAHFRRPSILHDPVPPVAPPVAPTARVVALAPVATPGGR